MQQMLPILNPTLKALAGLDPEFKGSRHAIRAWDTLADLLKRFLPPGYNENGKDIGIKIRRYQKDTNPGLAFTEHCD